LWGATGRTCRGQYMALTAGMLLDKGTRAHASCAATHQQVPSKSGHPRRTLPHIEAVGTVTHPLTKCCQWHTQALPCVLLPERNPSPGCLLCGSTPALPRPPPPGVHPPSHAQSRWRCSPAAARRCRPQSHTGHSSHWRRCPRPCRYRYRCRFRYRLQNVVGIKGQVQVAHDSRQQSADSAQQQAAADSLIHCFPPTAANASGGSQ
jgi:hypothetical protein